MTDIIPWIATAATITAALMTASNLGARVTGWGFAVFLVGSIAWLTHGLLTGQQALTWTNVALSLLNIFGMWRWLGRQAKVEEGAERAAERSADRPTDTLFPASLLTSAKVRGKAQELGRCVDAMLGCGDGKIRYIVVSEGGVAGLGETLRRLDWGDAQIDDGAVVAQLSQGDFDRLPTIKRDQWPER